MGIGANKFEVSRNAFVSKFSVLVLTLSMGLMPLEVKATIVDAQFKQFMTDLCINGLYGTLPASAITMCFNFQNGLALPGGFTNSANIGTANANSNSASRKESGFREFRDEHKSKSEKGASADGSGWGFLLTPQYSNSSRTETELENGYKASLKGLVLGVDYQFSDSLVFGATFSHTRDNATFFDGAGSLNSHNNTLAMYGTWIPSEKVFVDGYLGYGMLNFESRRYIVFGLTSGSIEGSTTGKQILAGMSASYQADIGRISLSPFLNLDYIKTNINGYNETGTTLLEFRYSDRSVASFTSSLGARLSSTYDYRWGAMQPSIRMATVHEFQNSAKQLSNELITTPGIGFDISTDSPDRNYLNVGLGVSAALNGGTQVFLDYDKRTQDKLLSSWAISLGVLMEL